MSGTVLAGCLIALAKLAMQLAVARNHEPLFERALGRIGLKVGHQHRRRRRQIVRVDDLQQMLGESRELVVHLELHPPRQEAETLQQPLDVGISALEPLQPQPPGDLRELAGEFPAQLAQVLEFSVVVFEQTGIHQCSLVRLASSTLT